MNIEQLLADIENALQLQLHGWRKDFLADKLKEAYNAGIAAVKFVPTPYEDGPTASELEANDATQ